MRISDLSITDKKKINEAGPAILAVPATIGGVELLGYALGFAGATGLALAVKEKPDAFSAPIRGAVRLYNMIAGSEDEAPDVVDQELIKKLNDATMSAFATSGVTPDDISEIENYLNGIKDDNSGKLTSAQRSALSAMPAVAAAVSNIKMPVRPGQETSGMRAVVDREADAAAAEIARRSAEIRADVDRAADARNALPSLIPSVADKEEPTLTATQRTAISDMPDTSVKDDDIDKTPAPDLVGQDIPEPTAPDVVGSKDLPDLTAPVTGPRTITPPAAGSGLAAPAPGVSIPGLGAIGLAGGAADLAKRLLTRTRTGAATATAAGTLTGGGGRRGGKDTGAANSTLKAPILRLNDPLNLRRNIDTWKS